MAAGKDYINRDTITEPHTESMGAVDVNTIQIVLRKLYPYYLEMDLRSPLSLIYRGQADAGF
jgi:hypothetical protein